MVQEVKEVHVMQEVQEAQEVQKAQEAQMAQEMQEMQVVQEVQRRALKADVSGILNAGAFSAGSEEGDASGASNLGIAKEGALQAGVGLVGVVSVVGVASRV